jgi:hypothetical protein
MLATKMLCLFLFILNTKFDPFIQKAPVSLSQLVSIWLTLLFHANILNSLLKFEIYLPASGFENLEGAKAQAKITIFSSLDYIS